MTTGLKSLYVFELDICLKKHSLPYKKKLKNEKIMLITSQLQEARGQTLPTMKVPGQRLLQANKHTSDDDDHESDGGHTVVVGETWCSESEGMFSESESDDSECELDHRRRRKLKVQH